MSESSWLEAHKGSLIDIIGEVWWCGDPSCDCTQAVIVERYQNLKAPGFVVRLCTWEGEFHTDGEPGAEDELTTKRQELHASDPELEGRIRWRVP